MIVLGIDPGLYGALAVVGPNTIEVYDMPAIETGKYSKRSKLARFTVDAGVLNNLISVLRFDHVMLEDVASMPRDGGVQAFSFGRTFGKIEAAICSYPHTYVKPNVWKKRLGMPHVPGQRERKALSRVFASRLMPHGARLWPLAKHDGRAEAALIAYYGAKHVL